MSDEKERKEMRGLPARLLNKSKRPLFLGTPHFSHILDARRVQHNTDAARGGGRRQVAPELSADNSIRPVCPQNLTPDAAELRRVGSGGVLRLVDKGNTFSQIEIRGRLILNALNFDQGSVLVLVAKTAFVSHDNSADVETVARDVIQWANGRRRAGRGVMWIKI